MQFNEYLRSCRTKNGLTQEQLTHELYAHDIYNFEGLDTTTVSKWERGSTKPHLSRQVSIIKYFQKRTGIAMPCWDSYAAEEAEELICKAGMRNLIGKSKKLIYNFPSEMMSVDDIKVYPLRNSKRMDALIDENMPLHQSIAHEFSQISREQYRKWALHPNSFFLACEYKDNFMGLFFSIKVKQDVFEKILNFEMRKSEITVDDLAAFNETGSSLILSFYAMNEKIATLIIIRYYAHLIAHQKYIVEIGGITNLEDAKKIVSRMNLYPFAKKIPEDNVEIEAFRQTLSNVLASENVVKMLLSKQECPEE